MKEALNELSSTLAQSVPLILIVAVMAQLLLIKTCLPDVTLHLNLTSNVISINCHLWFIKDGHLVRFSHYFWRYIGTSKQTAKTRMTNR